MSDEPRIKVGALARRLGVTPRTLRFYEDEGLLQAARSEGGTRFYRERDVVRLEAIVRLVRLGIPLAQIKALAHERDVHRSGARASTAVGARLAGLRTQCEAALSDLRSVLDELERLQALVRGCARCRRIPDSRHCPDCPVRLARDESRLASLVWDQD